MHVKTIIFVDNVALDHRAARKLDEEGFLSFGAARSAPDDNIALNLRSPCECDMPVDRCQVTRDGGFRESDGSVDRAKRSVDLRSRIAANLSVDGACVAVDRGVRTDPDTAVDRVKCANLTVISHGNAAVNAPALSGDSGGTSNGDS